MEALSIRHIAIQTYFDFLNYMRTSGPSAIYHGLSFVMNPRFINTNGQIGFGTYYFNFNNASYSVTIEL